MSQQEIRESVILENQGQKIFGILHRPLVPKPYPAVLMCHGLAGHKTGRYRLYVLLAERLSKLGIASLRIDFRGSGDSEGDFSDTTLSGEVSDAIKAMTFLRSLPDVDTSRIGIFGRSVGGVVALITARQVGNIKTLATWAPLFDAHQWEDKWKQLHAPQVTQEQREMLMRVNGQLPSYAFLKEIVELQMDKELAALKGTPLLHIHGEQDAVILPEHANRYQRARDDAQAVSNFIRLPGSDHDFSNPEERMLALEETAAWFALTL